MNIAIGRITAVVTSITIAATVAAQDAPAVNPTIDQPTVKVYLLAGQSNMEGKGAVNTLPWIGEDPKHGHLIEKIQNPDGSWKEGDDVWIDFLGRRGRLAVGYGSTGSSHGPLIGPEYGFGITIGAANDGPVLLVKAAWGGKDVANDFRGPTLGGADGPGEFYRRTIEHYKSTIAELGQRFPELAGRRTELAGIVWFQGWNDMVNKEKTAAYTANLAQMIRDLRIDLDAPDCPVVIGELGVDGNLAKGGMLVFRAAQAAVAEQPDLQGNVRFVRTAEYYDRIAHELYEQDVWKGPAKDRFYRIASDRPYHYLGSGKTQFLMGKAFADAMIEEWSTPLAQP
ncbi:MAG: sialate O-acetylesterase [Planctomycetota bacterium]|jgi:hypothetical protein|nr:sialate O-acetylesterase [Planctomycetota bacterium]